MQPLAGMLSETQADAEPRVASHLQVMSRQDLLEAFSSLDLTQLLTISALLPPLISKKVEALASSSPNPM